MMDGKRIILGHTLINILNFTLFTQFYVLNLLPGHRARVTGPSVYVRC